MSLPFLLGRVVNKVSHTLPRLTSVYPSVRLGFQQGLTCLFASCFCLEAHCPLPPLLTHGTMPLKILVLLDFIIQLNIDGMPIKVFTHTAAGLMDMLTVAECTPVALQPPLNFWEAGLEVADCQISQAGHVEPWCVRQQPIPNLEQGNMPSCVHPTPNV